MKFQLNFTFEKNIKEKDGLFSCYLKHLEALKEVAPIGEAIYDIEADLPEIKILFERLRLMIGDHDFVAVKGLDNEYAVCAPGSCDENDFKNELETKEWFCDKCKRKVLAEDAVISWKLSIDKNQIPHLVVPVGIYHKSCGPKFSRENKQEFPFIDLKGIDGPDGLSALIDYAKASPVLMPGFIEIIRRVFIPGYEAVKDDIEIARKYVAFEDNDTCPTPWQCQIWNIIKDKAQNPERYKDQTINRK